MNLILGPFAAILLTLVLTPLLVRAAPLLKLQDLPRGRRGHPGPMPLVGGLAIGSACLLAAVVWIPLDRTPLCFLLGAVWILAFGALDDVVELHFLWKALAQLPAVAIAVYGGLAFKFMPFVGMDAVPSWLSLVVTTLFLLGTINAVNLFDGLDGLAGGCMIMSLGAVAYLAYQVQDLPLVLMALIIMGSLLGFLHFNSQPALVFLGDAGSQFLGYCVGVLAIWLTSISHTALNPALPLLLLGLPLLDTAWVIFIRLRAGTSPFLGDRKHIHYLLVDGGLSQARTVAVIYLFQGLFVVSALLLKYASDLSVTGVFAIECGAFLGVALWLHRRGGPSARARTSAASNLHTLPDGPLTRLTWVGVAVGYALSLLLSLFIVVSAFHTEPIGLDLAVTLLVASTLALAACFLHGAWASLFSRFGFYVAGIFAIYSFKSSYQFLPEYTWALRAYLGLLAATLLAGIYLKRPNATYVLPQDLLIAFFALAVPIFPGEHFPDLPLGFMLIAGFLLLYSCEFLLSHSTAPLPVRGLQYSTVLSLVIAVSIGVAN